MPSSVLTIPSAGYAVGVHGPLVSVALPQGSVGYRCTYAKGATWPASGDALTHTVEISLDGGKTWRFDASVEIAGGIWYELDGVTETATGYFWVSLPPAGPATLLRSTWTARQGVDLGAVIESLP